MWARPNGLRCVICIASRNGITTKCRTVGFVTFFKCCDYVTESRCEKAMRISGGSGFRSLVYRTDTHLFVSLPRKRPGEKTKWQIKRWGNPLGGPGILTRIRGRARAARSKKLFVSLSRVLLFGGRRELSAWKKRSENDKESWSFSRCDPGMKFWKEGKTNMRGATI